MPENFFPFDRALVMDRMSLTGLALCDLSDSVAGRPCSSHVTTMSELISQLSKCVDERLLVITELVSDRELLSEGLEMLTVLKTLRRNGNCRVMVCTDLTDPLLLRAVLNRMPSVVALRREALSVLCQAIRMAGVAWPDTVLSPAVTDGIALSRDVKLTPRELEWLVTQADGLGLRASAKAMKVSYKTVATFRRNIVQRLGEPRSTSFTWRLAQIQRGTGSPYEEGLTIPGIFTDGMSQGQDKE